MKSYSKYFYGVMLIFNLVFAVYFSSKWLFAKSPIPSIPNQVIAENSLIKTEIENLKKTSKNENIVLALMSSKVNTCGDNKVVNFFKETRLSKPNLSLSILFSKNVTDQDISNFKDNFKLDFEVQRMNSDLSDEWEEISQKYETPAIVIVNKENNISASQNFTEVKKAINAF